MAFKLKKIYVTVLRNKVLVVLVVKNPPASVGDARDTGSIPELERAPGEGHGDLLQYSCLGNPMDKRGRVGYNP